MECKNCQQGNVLIENTITVSREMALDAGDPSLEGAAWDWGAEWVSCECCQGEWQDCPACNAEAQSNNVCTGLAITSAVEDELENELRELGHPSRRPASQ